MQDDPLRYWQDLTDRYRLMSDGELLSLAEKPEDLTDTAQQVLRDEMKLRKLVLTTPKPAPPVKAKGEARIRLEPTSYRYEFSRDETDQSEGPREYTWKTKLCDCETGLQAMQLAEALRRAGIDCWIQTSRTSADIMDLTYPRILVAADQLEQAQAVAAQPIPQDIIDESLEEQKAEPQDFEAPRCPNCGAPDPVLESADPLNVWLCESCGAEWSDPEPASADQTAPESAPS